MPIADGLPLVFAKKVPVGVAATDAAIVHIPYTGSGYVVRRVIVYNSKVLATGATANNATATLSVRGGAGGTGVVIYADAALAGVTGSTTVVELTPAATALTPIVTAPDLYLRVGTAGVASSGIDVSIEYSVLP